MKTGVAFGDFIRTEEVRKIRHSTGFTRRSVREWILLFVLFGGIVTLLGRVVYVQIINGSYFRGLSDNNRIRTSIIHAPRGIIFDRNHIPLVYNIPGFRQTVEGKTKLLSRETALSLLAKNDKTVEVDAHRQYPFQEAFAHVLGYVGQIGEDELKSGQYKQYNAGDLIGKSGIEKQYQDLLVGIDGKTLHEVDSFGKSTRLLGQTDPIAGNDIVTTLDSKLQIVAYNALPADKKGAVIITTPLGEVLTIASRPGFDPNLFTLDDTYKTSSTSAYLHVEDVLLDGNNQPLLNRAMSGEYPPGSTFKLITASAGLENKVIDSAFEVEDTGVVHLGDFSFSNWYFTQYGGKDGMVNVSKAIKRSNDIYFYTLAGMVGVDKISQMARKFGLGKPTGIDLAGELSGIVPDNAWKQRVIGEQWYLGDTYHYGIGQGYLLTTPLQVNMFTSVIANNGVLVRPHLIKSDKLQVTRDKFLSKETIAPIKQGMIESCSTGGVAWPLFEFKVKNSKLKIDGKNFFEVPEATTSASMKEYRHVSVACKTGTAQHGGLDTPPHAWITLFAPAEDPQIIVTVLVENGGEGSSIAGPVAKKILEEWFSR